MTNDNDREETAVAERPEREQDELKIPPAGTAEDRSGGSGSIVPPLVEDIEDLIERLLVYAAGRMRSLRWGGTKGDMTKVPYGYEPGELVNEAFEQAISKELLHGKTREDHFLILTDLIWKRTNHLATRVEQRILVRTRGDDKIIDLSSFRCNPEPSAEESLLAIEERSRLFPYLKNQDAMFPHLAHLMLLGVTSSIDIGTRLGMSVKDVNNLKKRMKRAVAQYGARHVDSVKQEEKS